MMICNVAPIPDSPITDDTVIAATKKIENVGQGIELVSKAKFFQRKENSRQAEEVVVASTDPPRLSRFIVQVQLKRAVLKRVNCEAVKFRHSKKDTAYIVNGLGV